MAALGVGVAESVRLYSGIEPQTIEAQEATGISANAWYKGDMVKPDGTTGLYDLVASTGAIGGIAQATGTGTDYEEFDLQLIDPAGIYLVRVEYGKFSARAYIGNNYTFTWTAGQQRIDIDDTTADIYIVGIYPPDKAADGSTGINEGRVLVRYNYDILTGV